MESKKKLSRVYLYFATKINVTALGFERADEKPISSPDISKQSTLDSVRGQKSEF